MTDTAPASDNCAARRVRHHASRERGVRAVVALTAVMMIVEIAVGYAAGSMALLADGWHMATHVGALGLAAFAYAFARRYAAHRAFAFGTGKVHALTGYTSSLALGLIGGLTVFESVRRLLAPFPVDYQISLPVACVGLLVNLVSVALLHNGEDEHHAHPHSADHTHDSHPHDGHEHAHHNHHHDHNHRAAFLHVVADALTSGLAIVALLAGRYLSWTWLDPATGILGGLVILKWSIGLCKHAAFDLIDVDPSRDVERRVEQAIETPGDARIADLHVWSLGQGQRACVVTVVAEAPFDAAACRARITELPLTHVTIEVRRPVGDDRQTARTHE